MAIGMRVRMAVRMRYVRVAISVTIGMRITVSNVRMTVSVRVRVAVRMRRVCMCIRVTISMSHVAMGNVAMTIHMSYVTV
jgi:hypothetical protein